MVANLSPSMVVVHVQLYAAPIRATAIKDLIYDCFCKLLCLIQDRFGGNGGPLARLCSYPI